MTTPSAIQSIPIAVDYEEIDVWETLIGNKLYLIDDKKNVYSVDTHEPIGTLNELEQSAAAAANCDKVCKNIGRLPLELRHAIFNCLTVDFRLEMIQSKSAQIIRTLYEAYDARILDIDALKEIVDKGLRLRFFYRKEKNGPLLTRPNLLSLLPSVTFKQMNETFSTQHPAFNALRKIVITPTIHGRIDSISRRFQTTRHARAALTKIVSTIINSCDILPTFTVDKRGRSNRRITFNYLVRKYTFQFICLLTKFVSKFKVPLEERAVEKLKIYFNKSIYPQMQRKIKLSAKKAAAKAIKDAKAVVAKVTKDAKAAVAKATKDAKAAVTKATKDAKKETLISR